MKWPRTLTIADAIEIQEQLKQRIRIAPFRRIPEHIAGADAAFSDDEVFAAVCLFRYPDLKLLEQACIVQPLRFPYVPGYLSFREGPAIIAAIGKLSVSPELILVDGQGIAHPRGIGIASHLGVQLNIATIGCAKTRLVGNYRGPGMTKGSRSALLYAGKAVGAVLRTRDRTRPIFVSPGHRTDIESAIRLTLGCTGKYRIPEPLRCADHLSRSLRKR